MNEIETFNKRQNNKSLIGLLVMLVILFVVVIFFSKELQVLSDFIRRLGWLGWLVSILIFGLFGATPIPSEPFTVFITTIYGPVFAAIITSFGNLLSAMVEYYVGDKLSIVADFTKMREQLPFGLNKVPVESPVFLIAARMLPSYGPKLISIISGIYKVPILRYLWTTAIATTIGAIAVAFGGDRVLALVIHK